MPISSFRLDVDAVAQVPVGHLLRRLQQALHRSVDPSFHEEPDDHADRQEGDDGEDEHLHPALLDRAVHLVEREGHIQHAEDGLLLRMDVAVGRPAGFLVEDRD